MLIAVISLQHAQQAASHLSEITHGRDVHGIVRHARVNVSGVSVYFIAPCLTVIKLVCLLVCVKTILIMSRNYYYYHRLVIIDVVLLVMV